MKKIIITFIIMLLTLGIHAQTSVELRTYQNPKIEELLKYAESMGKEVSVLYTINHKSITFSVNQYTDFSYTMTGDSKEDARREKMNKEFNEKRVKEALLIDSIRNTFMKLGDEVDGCHMWEYHQDGVDSIDYKMTLGAYSNKREVILDEWTDIEKKIAWPGREVITFYYKPDAPESISNEYHTNKGFGSFQYQVYVDSIILNYEQIDTKEYVKVLGNVMKKNGLIYHKLHVEMDSTYDWKKRKEIIDYSGYTKGEQCLSDIRIYESVPKEKGQEVLKELIDATWGFMDKHPTADLSMMTGHLFKKKGWNSPIIISNDYKKEGRESCSLQIIYLDDKNEYCFLIYDVKGSRVLPKDWQTLKSWVNGKAVYEKR